MSKKSTQFFDAGQLLKRIRKSLGLSQIQLSQKMAEHITQELPDETFTQSTVSQLENGHIRLSKLKLRYLCQILKLNPDEQSHLYQLYRYNSPELKPKVDFDKQTALEQLGRKSQEDPSNYLLRLHQISLYMQVGEFRMALMHAQDAFEKLSKANAGTVVLNLISGNILFCQAELESHKDKKEGLYKKGQSHLKKARLSFKTKKDLPLTKQKSDHTTLELHLLFCDVTKGLKFFQNYHLSPLTFSIKKIRQVYDNLLSDLKKCNKLHTKLKKEVTFLDASEIQRCELNIKYLFLDILESHYLSSYFKFYFPELKSDSLFGLGKELMKKDLGKLKGSLSQLCVLKANRLKLNAPGPKFNLMCKEIELLVNDLSQLTRQHFKNYINTNQKSFKKTLLTSPLIKTMFFHPIILARQGEFNDVYQESLYFMSNAQVYADYHLMSAQYFGLKYIYAHLNQNETSEHKELTAQHFSQSGKSLERFLAQPYLWLMYICICSDSCSDSKDGPFFAQLQEYASYEALRPLASTSS